MFTDDAEDDKFEGFSNGDDSNCIFLLICLHQIIYGFMAVITIDQWYEALCGQLLEDL